MGSSRTGEVRYVTMFEAFRVLEESSEWERKYYAGVGRSWGWEESGMRYERKETEVRHQFLNSGTEWMMDQKKTRARQGSVDGM